MKEYNPFGQQSQTNLKENYTGQDAAGAEQVQFPQFTNTKEGEAKHDASTLDEFQKKIEAAKSNGWGAQIGKFLGGYGKKTALAMIIALVVAGGFYAYSKNKQNMPDISSLNLTGAVKNTETSENTEFAFDNSGAQKETPEADSEAPLLDLTLDNKGEIALEDKNDTIPALSQENDSFITETAKSGDGITHLARYALKRYIKENDKSLTAEQKIYAEDYVQNKTGSDFLEMGQKLSFSKDLLNDAIEKAEALEDWQVQNLKQYSESASLL